MASGRVGPANFNCSGQIVISGEQGGCDAAAKLAEEFDGKAIPLQVAGAFHSELMRSAAEGLKLLAEIQLRSEDVDAALARVEKEGIAARFERHAAMARRTWAWAEQVGLGIAGRGSPTVTCLRPPEGSTGPRVAAALAERGYVIGAGYGKWKEATFRIGHMGDQTLETLDELLAAIAETLMVR